MRKKYFLLFLITIFGLLFLFRSDIAYAQEAIEETESLQNEEDTVDQSEGKNYEKIETKYFEAVVKKVIEEKETKDENGQSKFLQKIELEGVSGEKEGKKIIFEGIKNNTDTVSRFKKGDHVLMSLIVNAEGEDQYFIEDYVRYGRIYLIVISFIVLVLVFARWRGFRALLGLVFSFIIILKFVVPQIVDGKDPLMVTLFFSLIIIVFSTYLVYGLNRKATIAMAGTFLGLVLVGVFSVLYTKFSHLTGFAEEEVVFLINLMGSNLNVEGLLLSGMVIGALGLLDDVTVSQVATVEEIYLANPNLTKKEIYKKAMKVGIDHNASMVNTLFLAYAGASMPLLLLFTFKQAPFDTFQSVIDHEIIATEIVRTIVGSIGLTLAIPLTTLLATIFITKKNHHA